MQDHRAPELSERVLQQELTKLFAREHRSSWVAFFGRGARMDLSAKGSVFKVIPTRSELELRAEMASQVYLNVGTVFLVPWADELPMDIACRLATGRVRRISRDTRLGEIFGAREVAPDLRMSALGRWILRDSQRFENLAPVTGLAITYQLALERVLHHFVETFDPYRAWTAPQLILWFSRTSGGHAFLDALRAASEADLEKEVITHLKHSFGPLCAAAFEAWRHEDQDRFLGQVFALESLKDVWGTRSSFAEGMLQQALHQHSYGALLLDSLESLTDANIAAIVSAGQWTLNDFTQFQQSLQSTDLIQELGSSRYLPIGRKKREAHFYETLGRTLEHLSQDSLLQAFKAHEQVLKHSFDSEYKPAKERRMMLLRLASLLLEIETNPPVKEDGHQTPYQEANEWAAWYASEGGYIDVARHHLHKDPGEFLNITQAILRRVDGLRAKADQRFAQGLQAWLDAGQPTSHMLPIGKVSKHLIADFLKDKPERRMLVILLDGMSHEACIQILQDLENEPDHWLPIQWQPTVLRNTPRATGFPVAASLPTLTHVSRAAFFAGKDSPQTFGKENNTAKDTKRWANNPSLKRYLELHEAPLLLKNDVASGGGLSQKCIQLIEDEHTQLAGVVLNTIDDQLSGSSQIYMKWGLENLHLLRMMLNIAAMSDRVVLLASDHGHSLAYQMKSQGAVKEPGGKRWRALSPHESVEPYEIELRGPHTFTPAGSDRIACLWDEKAVYGTPGYGEHGGASLAEVMSPCWLIAPENLADIIGAGAPDQALKTQRRYAPEWWDLERITAPRPTAKPPTKNARKAPSQSAQTDLFDMVAPSLESPRAQLIPKAKSKKRDNTQTLHPLAEALQKSATFKAVSAGHPESRVLLTLQTVTALVNASGSSTYQAFSKALNLPPFRVSGAISQVQQLLNHEGETVLGNRAQAKLVQLNIELLKQLFELK